MVSRSFRLLLTVTCAASCLAVLSMNTQAAARPTATQRQENAEDISAANIFIQKLGDQALAILSDKQRPPEEKDSDFQDILRRSFDLPTIARFVIGRNAWFGATEEEKAEYLQLFEKLVVRIYSDRFSLYSGEKFYVQGQRQEGERDTMVTSHIMRPDSSRPIVVDWRVRNFNGRQAIIDVVVEGVSMSVTQRQEYGSVLQRNDNRLTPLLALMRDSLDKQDLTNR